MTVVTFLTDLVIYLSLGGTILAAVATGYVMYLWVTGQLHGFIYGDDEC